VLYKTIEQNHPVEIDWREFLTGESGFVTIKSHRSLTFGERKRALNNVRLACASLLRSVLDDTAWSDNRVRRLMTFIDNLQVKAYVPRLELRTPELEITGGVTE